MHTDIQYLKGIGPKRYEALRQSGIKSVADLIDFIPRRYLDRSQVATLDTLQVDQEVTVIGKIEALGIRRARKRIFYLIISDGRGILEALWFNYAEQYKKQFKVGEWISLSGKISYFRGYQMIHPAFEHIGDEDFDNWLASGKIFAIYPSSDILKKVALNSNWFRKIFTELFQKHQTQIEENLPAALLQTNNFLPRPETYFQLHLPQSLPLLQQAVNRYKYEEFFFWQLMFALQNYHTRQSEAGITFAQPSQRLTRFYETLPFAMTAAQKKVVKEIRLDMKRPHPMNRLLQGDVGSGKTLVAIMSMLIAVDNGYQTALMVPTEILAEQHFFNFSKMLNNLKVQMILLTGSTSREKREHLRKVLNDNQPVMVIGTHALIQEDLDFSRLGLIIIDEQHRFGVMQRGSLQEKGLRHADVLVMTATPIPRTLALTIYGNLDVSILDEMPPNRKTISTVWRFDDKAETIYDFIKQRLEKNEQAFIVFPLLQESEKLDLKAASESYEKFKRDTFANWPIALIHGRLKSDQKEKIMHDFIAGRIKILVSTTVIEVGVDVPQATIMLIEHAERFGLSQLHQLRGRVGRSHLKSYCILKTPHNIGDTARQRMRIMTETGDGFKIAEEDLRLRGWGDFFGTRQHGIPEFKLANPLLDFTILQKARQDAQALVKMDPQLRSPENLILQNCLQKKFSERFRLIKFS
jgi:ATP-dependent DNA helicase RecG